MKTTFLKISVILLFLNLIGAGCEKDNNSENCLIVREFPVLYIGYNLKSDETVIIRDQETFGKVFSKELISQIPDLQNIDFTKYNVLAGQTSTPSGFAKLKHTFTKFESNSYLYKLAITYEEVGVPLNFCFGIIVNKLPSKSVVKFEVII